MKNKKVIVGLSGGVDSSVAAYLLKNKGYDVTGVTMAIWGGGYDAVPTGKHSCYGPDEQEEIREAREVAEMLDIPYHVFDCSTRYKALVLDYFKSEYLSGRTPNPCVRCNQFIKFGILLKKAINLGAQFLATGHYARVVKSSQGYLLKKAKDLKKDQSYFLYRLDQNQLKHIIFPLGNITKPKVRSIAAKLGLNVAEKKDSQEICFLPDGEYRNLIQAKGKNSIKPGELVDKDDNILGQHRGIPFYTIGQRQGLGIARGYPLYVIRINSRNNRITVGSREDASRNEFLVGDVHFLAKPFKKKVEIKVRIRYNHKESLAAILVDKNKLKVFFKNPQFAITPGQSAVFYHGDIVVGGGIIEKVRN